MHADQLSCLTKESADKATETIKNQEFLVLFCGCCDNNDLEMVKVLSGTQKIKVIQLMAMLNSKMINLLPLLIK